MICRFSNVWNAKTFETRLSNLQFGLQTPWNPGPRPQRPYRKLGHRWSGERSVSFLRLEGPRRLQNRERHIRFCGRIRISLTLIDWRQHPEREQRIRDLFTRNGIPPVQDDRGDRELILMYPLPDSAQRIASLCSEVLASGYGVADDEPLLFTLIQYP